MPKIILIDDNSRDQRRAYGADYIDENIFDDIVDHFERVDQNTDFSFIENAACVLVHDSLEDFTDGHFNPESHIAKDLIVTKLDNLHIPYVCFSDGHAPTGLYDSDKNIVELKKSEFYNRLRPFLENFRSYQSLDFRILAYGKNFRRILMTKYVRSLFQQLDTKPESVVLSATDVLPVDSKEPHFLEEIVILSQPAIGMGYNDVLNFIDDEEITIKEFKARIKSILNSVIQYGKNTYTWK